MLIFNNVSLFLRHKDEAFEIFCNLVQNEKESNIISLRSDHGGEFENLSFKTFFDKKGISHNFSCARTPQQNGVVERKKSNFTRNGKNND